MPWRQTAVRETFPSNRNYTGDFVSLNPKENAVFFFRVIDGVELEVDFFRQKLDESVLFETSIFRASDADFVPSIRRRRTVHSAPASTNREGNAKIQNTQHTI